MNEQEQPITNIMPLLPLRGSVIYPFMVIPLFVNRPKSVNALEACVVSGKQIFFVAQKDEKSEDPKLEDLYTIGTISNILQVLKLPDGTIKVLAEGIKRGRVKNIIEKESFVKSEIEILEDIVFNDTETQVLIRHLLNEFEDFIKLNPKIPAEILSALTNITDPGRLADAIVAHLPLLKIEDKQKVLETQDTKERLRIVTGLLMHELELLRVEEKLKSRVKTQVNKTQQEFYLNEKLKAIQKELDELNEGRQPVSEMEKLKAKNRKRGLEQRSQRQSNS
jgi:ATP-dependent Lon protease